MAVKVVFIGNPLGGDDGVGPYLYNELKDNPKLKDLEMMELGVIGFDLLSYIEDNDKLIIVDAVRAKDNIGEVILLQEKDLSKDLSLISQHDFGVEQTATILRAYKPELENINVIGIKVSNLKAFSDKLSDGIVKKLPKIKKEVIKYLLKIAYED